jgi:hypothetical protein
LQGGLAGIAAAGAIQAGIAGGRALDVARRRVAFEADNETANLPVVAPGRADEAAGYVIPAGIEGKSVGLVRLAPAAAGLKAEIEAGPVRLRHGWSGSHDIGGMCCACHETDREPR